MRRWWISHFLIFFFLSSLLCFLPEKVFAQVVINEFSSGTTSDWVEIYNLGEPRQIANLNLLDGDGNRYELSSCLLNKNGSYSVDWSNRLNNAGDRISLIEGDLVIDCVSYGGGPVCEGKSIDLPVLSSSEYGIRQPEGTGGWTKTNNSTRSDNSFCLSPSLTPTLTPTPTLIPPTLTPTPTQIPLTSTPTPLSSAIYKINEVKNENGDILNNVEVYLDDVYVHHYAPETLTFCSGCKCDTYVDCGFGVHTIKLKKSDYNDWTETKTINSGDNFEVNPVMNLIPISSPTSTPFPTSIPTITPTKTPTPTSILTSTPTKEGELKLIGETSGNPVILGAQTSPLPVQKKNEGLEKFRITAGLFIFSGLLLLGLAGFFLYKQKSG